MGGLLGTERGRGHAGLGIDLQKDQFVLNIVITKVGSRHAAAAHGGVGQLGLAQRPLEQIGRLAADDAAALARDRRGRALRAARW